MSMPRGDTGAGSPATKALAFYQIFVLYKCAVLVLGTGGVSMFACVAG